MKVRLLVVLLLFGIVPLVLLVLRCWKSASRAEARTSERAHAAFWHAAGASRGLCWTACGAVALPEPLAHRWNSPYFYRNDWETMAALSELVGDDIRIMWRCSDREVPMCLRLPPQTRHGQLGCAKIGTEALN